MSRQYRLLCYESTSSINIDDLIISYGTRVCVNSSRQTEACRDDKCRSAPRCKCPHREGKPSFWYIAVESVIACDGTVTVLEEIEGGED